jgi:hypothetical protein
LTPADSKSPHRSKVFGVPPPPTPSARSAAATNLQEAAVVPPLSATARRLLTSILQPVFQNSNSSRRRVSLCLGIIDNGTIDTSDHSRIRTGEHRSGTTSSQDFRTGIASLGILRCQGGERMGSSTAGVRQVLAKSKRVKVVLSL